MGSTRGVGVLESPMKHTELSTSDLKALQRLPKPEVRHGLMVSALVIGSILIEIGFVLVLLVACWVHD